MITLPPKQEAALITYITMQYLCDDECRKLIGEAIQLYGISKTKIVYRGQSKKDKTIQKRGYFISTTPKKKMAELFVQRDWDKPEHLQRVGHLFKIHLQNVPTLSTRDINQTLSRDVIQILINTHKNVLIEKRNEKQTIQEYIPQIRHALEDLVFSETAGNSEEILVPVGYQFSKDRQGMQKGFLPLKNGDFETWQQ